MSILFAESKSVKEVFVKKLDFRTVIALAMMKKTNGSILIKNASEDFDDEDFVLVVSYVSKENEIFNVMCRSLEEIAYDFIEAYNVTSYEAEKFIVNDFVKPVEGNFENVNDASVNSLIKCKNGMLDMCLENASKEVIDSLIEIADKLILEEAKKAVTKSEEYEYFASCEVEDKVIILDRMVNPNNLATYLNEVKSDALFAVISMQNAYKYAAIPVGKNIGVPRRKVPNMFSTNPIERIREMTGAKSLKQVNKDGYGGVCGTLEDAVRIATLAANL
jgi:hypothetical protein